MLKFLDLSVLIHEKKILSNIDFQIEEGKVTALVGVNGSGKSTLLSSVNGEIQYTGKILFGEDDISKFKVRERSKLIAYLPQQIPRSHITVREMVSFGRNPYLDFTGRITDKDKEIIEKAMAEADVLSLADRYADSLSGGEFQRAALAMLIAQDTRIYLLDEPTASMDRVREAAFLRKIRMLNCELGKTFLVVLHDISATVEYADNIVILDEGKLVFSGSVDECLHNKVLEKTFGLVRYTFENGKIFFDVR